MRPCSWRPPRYGLASGAVVAHGSSGRRPSRAGHLDCDRVLQRPLVHEPDLVAGRTGSCRCCLRLRQSGSGRVRTHDRVRRNHDIASRCHRRLRAGSPQRDDGAADRPGGGDCAHSTTEATKFAVVRTLPSSGLAASHARFLRPVIGNPTGRSAESCRALPNPQCAMPGPSSAR